MKTRINRLLNRLKVEYAVFWVLCLLLMGVRALPLVEALQSYCRWNEVRMAMLLVPALFNFSVYYWTLNTTGLLCGIMVLVASLFCVPGRNRLLAELDLSDLPEA